MEEAFWNSDILKLIAVLLAIVVIVFLFLKYKSPEQNSKVHLYYISGLGVFIILELVTYICINNDNTTEIVNYISFASTLSSLLLSVVAIIYAIVSNNKGNVQYLKIDNASDRISMSVEKFSLMSENLTENVNSILYKLDELRVLTDETKKAVSLGNQQNKVNVVSNETTVELDKIIERYISSGSYFGNLALLACVYSKDFNKPFYTNSIIPEYSSYLLGYIVSSSSFGIISARTMDDIVSVDGYYSNIKEALIENIERYIENSHPNQKEYNKSLYNKIKDLFGIN